MDEKKNRKVTTKKKTKARQFIKKVILIILIIGVLITSVVAGAFFGFVDNSTDLIAQEYNLDFSSMLYYVDEETGEPVEIDRLYSEQNRIWVDIEDTPKYLRDAFVAIEDERFDSHKGVDWKRTLGAVITYFFKGNKSYGGSTITQQLIKNITGDDKRSPIRKVQEIARALNLEKKMEKDDIIEMYMNTIYLGQGCHGVQAASNIYYSKDVSELDLAECASIAGITQYPSRYDPILNYEEHKKKQELVLDKMLELGYITEEECIKAKEEELRLIKGTAKASDSRIQSYFVDQVVIDVLNDLITRNNMSESAATKLLFKGGLKIYTTIDTKVQKAMEEVFENNSNFPGASGANGPQSAMIVIDPYTGYIKGIVGGRGEKTGNRVLNRATQTVRQPGSSIKPLSVYAPGFEQGTISPATVIEDLPLSYENGAWPRNDDREYAYTRTIFRGVVRSVNAVAANTLEKIGTTYGYEFAKDCS